MLSGVNFGTLMVLYSKIGGHVLTPFFVRDDDRSGLIGEGKVTMYFDSRWKPACKDGCR